MSGRWTSEEAIIPPVPDSMETPAKKSRKPWTKKAVVDTEAEDTPANRRKKATKALNKAEALVKSLETDLGAARLALHAAQSELIKAVKGKP